MTGRRASRPNTVCSGVSAREQSTFSPENSQQNSPQKTPQLQLLGDIAEHIRTSLKLATSAKVVGDGDKLLIRVIAFRLERALDMLAKCVGTNTDSFVRPLGAVRHELEISRAICPTCDGTGRGAFVDACLMCAGSGQTASIVDGERCAYCGCSEFDPCELQSATLSHDDRCALSEYFAERGESIPDVVPCWWVMHTSVDGRVVEVQQPVCSNPRCLAAWRLEQVFVEAGS